jgi:hypothetical protein
LWLLVVVAQVEEAVVLVVSEQIIHQLHLLQLAHKHILSQ